MGISRSFFNLLFGASKAPESVRADSRELEDWVFAGNYRVLNRMGTGGSACVLRATDLALKREVALKVLLESEETNAELAGRFLAEGRTLASIQHPNVVTVYSLGVDERLKFPFLVMEMVKGATLANRLEEFRNNPLLLYREMITVFEAIHFCHQKQIIHLDLKPSNLMIDQKGKIRIIDFGISLTASQRDSSPFIMGTVYYMAPEQFQGTSNLSAKTDIYSLGIVMWELLTGKPPFSEQRKGSSDPFAELEDLHCHAPLPVEQLTPLPHAVPLIPLLSRMLAKNPADRPEIPHIVQFLKEELLAQGGRIGERYDVLQATHQQGTIHQFKAKDRTLQRLVGIEMLSAEFGRKPDTIQVFLARAETLSKEQQGLSVYPRVLSIDRDATTQVPYVVREFVEGISLAESLPSFQVAPLRLMNIFVELVQQVQKSHQKGLAHGNLCLENILLDVRDQPRFIGFDYFALHDDAVLCDVRAVREMVDALFEPLLLSWPTERDLPDSLAHLLRLLESLRESDDGAPLDLAKLIQEFDLIRRQFEIDKARFSLEPKTALGTLIHEKLARITEIDLADDHTGIAVLETALRNEEDPVVIAAALPVIARLERRSELPLIFPYLTHHDPGVRLAALEAVNIVGEIGVCLQVFDLLNDETSRVRLRAASILKNFGDDRLKEQLQTFAMFGLPHQQAKAVKALRYYPCEEHLTLLELMLQNPSPDVVKAAQEVRLVFLTEGLANFEGQSTLEPMTRSRIDDLSDHIIICGYGRKGQVLLNSLLDTDQDCVVIEADGRKSGLELAKARGVPTLTGSANHAVTLYSAGITRARYVLAVTNDDETNLEIAMKVKMFLGNSPRPPSAAPLQCLSHVFSPSLRRMTTLFHRRRHRRPTRFEGLSTSPGFEFRLFNIFENAARQMLLQFPPPVRAFREQIQGKPIHLLIVGLSPLGSNLIVQAAQMFQGTAADMLHITVIDSAKNLESSAFRFHYPRIDRVVSLNLVPLEPKVVNSATIERLSALEPFSAVYLSLADALLNRQCARIVRSQASLDPLVPVVYVGSRNFEVADSTSAVESGCTLYDVFASTCHIDAIVRESQDDLARAIHGYLLETSRGRDKGMPADPRHVPWERLRGDLKEYFRAQADHIRVKLWAIGCAPMLTAEGGARQTLSETELNTLLQIERQHRMVETLLSATELHESLDLSGDAEYEECASHVKSIPEVLKALGMQIQRLP